MNAPGRIVWLTSFPKSGNTWFRIFLANLAAGEHGPTDINNLDERGGNSCSRHEFEVATFLDSGLIGHDEIDDLRPQVYRRAVPPAGQRWIKVHDGYTAAPSGELMFGLPGTRAIYLVRDPRDVAISLAFHNSSTVNEAIALMNDADAALCPGLKGVSPQLRQRLLGWSGHVASWLDQTDIPVYCLRYEDLRAEPERHFTAALQFAERTASQTDIQRAVRHADFGELQRQEAERGFAERMSPMVPFFREGRVGSWREQLSDEQIARIEDVHATMMLRLGYGLHTASNALPESLPNAVRSRLAR